MCARALLVFLLVCACSLFFNAGRSTEYSLMDHVACPCMGRDETFGVCWLCIIFMTLVRDTLSVGSPAISM